MGERTLKSVSAVSLGLMMGAISAVIAFIVAIIMALVWVPIAISASTISDVVPGFGVFAGLGVLMIIIIPVFAFIAGFIQGLIIAVVYNFLAPRIGGIRVRVE